MNRFKQYIINYQQPTLLYDLIQIKKNMIFLTEVCKNSPVKMLFTVKSFPYKKIINLAYKIMPGFEISNLNEYKLLPKDLKNIILSINDPTGQLNYCIPQKISKNNTCYLNLDTINNDNLDNFKPKIHYGVRISHSSLIDTANTYVPESRFGSHINKLKIFKEAFFNRQITGLHLHNGSEKNSIENYLEMANQILYKLKKENIKISFFNLGGGLHLLTNQQLEELIKKLTLLFAKYNIKIFFEPGRYITNNAGYALGKIYSIKKVSNKKYKLLVDLSSECHIKWSDPILIINKKEKIEYLKPVNLNITTEPESEQKLTVSIGGPTCFEHDCLGIFKINPVNGKLPFKLHEVLVFANITGYSAAWNTTFNGIERATVLFI